VTANHFQQLLAVAGEQDKAELGLAHNARIDALNKYQKNPGRETKNNLDAARDFYDETVERLWPVYFPDDAAKEPQGETFRNKKAAFDWIIANHGNLVSVGKFYQDCGNGNPLTFPDKTVSKFSVLEYVLKQKAKNGSSTPSPSTDLDARKQKADTEKAEDDARIARVKADEAERERDARWMLQEDHEDAMAAFAGLCEDIFRHRVYLDHQLLLTAGGGDSGRSAEFALALQSFADRAFNDVADYKEIDVEFEEDDDE
jgi:hypothetical protein